MIELELMGQSVHVASEAAVLDSILNLSSTAPSNVYASVNVHWLALRQRRELPEIAYDHTYFLLDGAPAAWAVSGELGGPAPRIAGSTLLMETLALASEERWRVALIGGPLELLANSESTIAARYPGIEVVSAIAPSRDDLSDPSRQSKLASEIADATPRVVVVGLGQPRQEVFAVELAKYLKGAAILCIGGSLQFLTNERRRAPQLIQRLGLEWAWRISQDPKYLWRRYLVEDRSVGQRLVVQGLLLRCRRVVRSLRARSSAAAKSSL